MQRYHKKVYFPDVKELEQLNNCLNNMKFTYSKHCLDNLKYRTIDIKSLLLYISDLKLVSNNIFEYYKDRVIEKACYRIPYNSTMDLILVLSSIKNIVTIYLNTNNDFHSTLKESIYCKVDK